MNLPASQIKPKDIITLDCGYGMQEDYINCKVLEVGEERGLFNKDEKLISFFVEQQDYTKHRFHTVTFKPTDLIEVFSIYKKKEKSKKLP
jgi:hypothetical protein